MAIRSISVQNIKNFRNFNIRLGDFNVFIGGNASGKSNLISILKFITDLKSFSFEDAFSMQGGIDYFRNLFLGSSIPSIISITFDSLFKTIVPYKNDFVGIDNSKTKYDFTIIYKGYNEILTKEKLKFFCYIDIVEKDKFNRFVKAHRKNEDYITFSRNINNKLSIYSSKQSLIDVRYLKPWKKIYGESILSFPIFRLYVDGSDLMDTISFFDFDPKLSKKAVSYKETIYLKEDGSNLSLVMNKILNNNKKKSKFINIMNDLLPFVVDFGISKLKEKSIYYTLEESYYIGKQLPAYLTSDGTANLIALIIALYYDNSDIIVIEEPERSIHPYLLNKLIDIMKDASRKKQIIITTHNPEIIKYAGINNIYFISRSESGYSSIFKPKTNKKIKHFLKHDIGIEELFVDNLIDL